MLNQWDAVSTLDRVLDDVMGTMVGTAKNPRAFEPAIDVRTNENEILLICDLPGVRREDLDITLENHVLTLKGTRHFEGRERERVMLGRAYGSFARAVALPDSIDEGALTAELADGVLTVRLPRHEKAKARKITIGGAPTRRPSTNASDAGTGARERPTVTAVRPGAPWSDVRRTHQRWGAGGSNPTRALIAGSGRRWPSTRARSNTRVGFLSNANE